MLWNMKDLHGFTIGATDGDIGSVKEFYFDDLRDLIGASAHASSKLVKNATLKVYPGGSHGLADYWTPTCGPVQGVPLRRRTMKWRP
jgi:hypothetical protein